MTEEINQTSNVAETPKQDDPQTPTPQMQGNPDNTRNIVTGISFLTCLPTGCIFFPFVLVPLLLMWFWTHWRKWIKIVLTLLLLIPVAFSIIAIILIGINPGNLLKRAECIQQCQTLANQEECVKSCAETGIPTKMETNEVAPVTNPETESPLPIEQTTPQPAKFPDEFRTSFLASCTKGGSNATLCECTLNYVEQNTTYNQFLEDAKGILTGKGTPQVLLNAVNACK